MKIYLDNCIYNRLLKPSLIILS
ncbi:hypothetical protein HKBW3S25_01821, partial [Candidatus Hakubella thermalkaliphila]